MAESLSRLRLGSRSRTPSGTTPRSSNSNEGDTTRDAQPGEHRRPSSSRISSQLASPEPDVEPLPTDDDTPDLIVRTEDQVWYNPSLDQMVEAIQVLLMTRGVMEPIPIKYNSYVLHLIEGFANAKENLRKAESAYEEANRLLEHNLELWNSRESQYRAEVKRLEVLLSKTSRDGLEAVTLARANSIVDRRSKSLGLLSMPSRSGRDHVDDAAGPLAILTKDHTPRTLTQTKQNGKGVDGRELKRVPTPKILDRENDFLISEKFRRLDAIARADASPKGRRGNTNTSRDNLCRPLAGGSRYPSLTHQRSISSATVISASNNGTHAQDLGNASITATTNPSYQQGQTQVSGFPFDARDNVDSTEQKQGHSGPHNGVCHQKHEHSGILATNGRACHETGDIDSFPDSPFDRKQRASTEGGSSANHARNNDSHVAVRDPSPYTSPVAGCHDSDGGRETEDTLPSQSRCSLDSLTANAVAGQENVQTQQTGMDARLAAARALANMLGGTRQRK